MEVRQVILDLIRTTVNSMVDGAQIYLFGSRARGTFRDDSDWDVLVLVDAPAVTEAHKDIDYELWMKGLDLGQVINCVIRTQDQWRSNPSLFKHNVLNDCIRL